MKDLNASTTLAYLLGNLGSHNADLMVFEGRQGDKPFTVVVATGAAQSDLGELVELVPGWEGELAPRVRV